MMDKRTTLALLLMAALLMIYPAIFMRQEPERAPQKTEAPAAPPKPLETAAPPTQPAASPPPKEAPAVPERTAVVETPLYRAEIGSAGGRIQGWELHYRGAKPMVAPGILVSRGIFVNRPGQPPRSIAVSLSTDKVAVPAGGGAGELVLSGEDGFGLRITEVLRFHADSYVVDHQLKVENRHSQAQSAEVMMAWQAAVELPKDTHERFQGQHPIRVVRLVDSSVHRDLIGKIGEFNGPGQWIGLESEWYLTAMIPRSAGFRLGESKVSETRPDLPKPLEFGQVALHAAIPALNPGQSWEGQAQSYLGPKEYDRLKAVGVGLENSIYFGGFPLPRDYGGLPMEWLVVPVLWVMHRFYAFTHNYGIAIILLTVITKVIFFPLTIKSMTSMKAMQALQPQVNALRSKYKSDPQRLQRETMELYRVHKVNPLGGCLPMVVQIPIFYALYVALSVSVEIQNAPFICFGRLFGVDLWICDLAAHDPTYVLPILMGISMFIQQKMTPVMGDPRQAKMMLFMPVVFTFMFLNLPAGLVLYWTLSNVLQIAQQKYMERVGGKPEKVPAKGTKKA
ncbi:MAG TPA: membrane protein insertase YidC [Methylomirabilota bacterium]|jgi:YidC/Oxa1 family membrane protein insertase